MFYLGGIYIDMDNGCHRSFRELVTTVEALNPDASHIAIFSSDDAVGLQTDFMISTANHPIYKQFISRLHLFNHRFLIHHLTILLSAGPLYATVQERLFCQTKEQVVRLLDKEILRSMFWKTNGGTWFGRDTLIILYLYYNRDRILWYCKMFAIWLVVVFIVIVLYRQERGYFRIQLTIIQSNYYSSLKNSRRQWIRLINRRLWSG
jgi:mannosyltransferase OCH1-like enzyme